MKKELEQLAKSIEESTKVHLELMARFRQIKDYDTVDKLRILNEGYNDCLKSIKLILINENKN